MDLRTYVAVVILALYSGIQTETLQQKESSYSDLQEALKTKIESLQVDLTRQTNENVRLSEQLQQVGGNTYLGTVGAHSTIMSPQFHL